MVGIGLLGLFGTRKLKMRVTAPPFYRSGSQSGVRVLLEGTDE